jgi:hypothetical protein
MYYIRAVIAGFRCYIQKGTKTESTHDRKEAKKFKDKEGAREFIRTRGLISSVWKVVKVTERK